MKTKTILKCVKYKKQKENAYIYYYIYVIPSIKKVIYEFVKFASFPLQTQTTTSYRHLCLFVRPFSGLSPMLGCLVNSIFSFAVALLN